MASHLLTDDLVGKTIEIEGELAKAIQLASDNDTVVKFGDEVIWQPEA